VSNSGNPTTNNKNQTLPYTFYLPTAFAVRESEPKLAQAINNCLRILKNNGYIFQYLRYRHGPELGDKVMWEDELARTVAATDEGERKTKRIRG
jgi:hypothetical protein